MHGNVNTEKNTCTVPIIDLSEIDTNSLSIEFGCSFKDNVSTKYTLDMAVVDLMTDTRFFVII